MKKKMLRYISLLLFFIFVLNFCFPCMPARAEAASTPVALAETGSSVNFVSFSDIAGHWAEKGIKAWTARSLAGGYPDGTFRPDSSITRAEFVTLVNRAFGYTNMADAVDGQAMSASASVSFRDVAATDWYAGEIAEAAVVGYLGGYPDGTVKPLNSITRQEVAVFLSRVLPLSGESAFANGFTDETQFPAWSQTAIVTAVNGGYMGGYPDGTFQPNRQITRAEAISVLDRAVGTLYNRAGTYGPFQGNVLLKGNVTISTSGVTLQNTTITGNLYLTEGIGEGEVTLKNVTVQGTTKIAGGGRDSICLRDSNLGNVLVNVPSRKLVRILAQGGTAVDDLEARTPARLEEEGLTGSGFSNVIVNKEPGIIVELLGNYNEVEVRSAGAQLALQRGSITNLTLSSTAQGAQIKLAAQTSINTMTADAPATVHGHGSLHMLETSVDGVVVGPSIITGDCYRAGNGGKRQYPDLYH